MKKNILGTKAGRKWIKKLNYTIKVQILKMMDENQMYTLDDIVRNFNIKEKFCNCSEMFEAIKMLIEIEKTDFRY